jgi:hypothetical protein
LACSALQIWAYPTAEQRHRVARERLDVWNARVSSPRIHDNFRSGSFADLLAQQLPNAQLRIYRDSGYGFLGQYPELFADDVTTFLNGG